MVAALEVQGLSVRYAGGVQAVRDVSLSVQRGEVLGIVGESGCGKSTLAVAMMNLLPAGATVTAGAVRINGRDLLQMTPAEQRTLRGGDVAMVFQDPMTAFNPVLRLGDQLADFTRRPVPEMTKMLARVGIPDPSACLKRYPHELSGGMRQRVAIAAALLVRPAVLIADEPTTALDVTMEAQILHLLRELKGEVDAGIVVVTHHIGVVATLCDRVVVLYAGEVVEEGPVDAIFHDPRHPYTRALLACDPAVVAPSGGHLPTIGGRPPDLARPPPGCAFAARCKVVRPDCSTPVPRVIPSAGRSVLCHAEAAR